jgi:hypothetical protein
MSGLVRPIMVPANHAKGEVRHLPLRTHDHQWSGGLSSSLGLFATEACSLLHFSDKRAPQETTACRQMLKNQAFMRSLQQSFTN